MSARASPPHSKAPSCPWTSFKYPVAGLLLAYVASLEWRLYRLARPKPQPPAPSIRRLLAECPLPADATFDPRPP